MECLWGLFGHWQQNGNRYEQYSSVFHVCLHPYSRFADYHLHGTCFLEKYEKIHLGGEEKSVVLFVSI